MNDKELLELAAKAIGHDIEWFPQREFCIIRKGFYDSVDDEKGEFVIEGGGTWNPLTDDGDALRLAVKLGISIHYVAKDDGKTLIGVIVNDCELEEIDELDICKAARRAITRAAAEIGKT